MKKLYLIILLLILTCATINLSQDFNNQKFDPNNPVLIKPVSHDPNFKDFPLNSFYQSREDWHHIIDSVWGLGFPLATKLAIFNTYTTVLRNQFDGFLSLGINWDSLKSFYQMKIDDTTSRGGFSAIMSHLALSLRDYHTQAYDKGVTTTPCNPGVPLLMLSGFLTVQHFGAVLTVLPDGNACVIRAVNNHPLNLEPGDIILGYEGIPWSQLVDELYEYELPSLGSLGGALTVNNHQKLICSGMNWHLFDTIDILKYSTGDTLHLPTSLMVGLNVPQMLNNEQVVIPGVPFPDFFNNQLVSYGIINNTNIGYIYLFQEYPQNLVDQQFFEAVDALQNTDGLIIDLRMNFGGWAFFDDAFEILFNDSHLTIEDAHRCNINTFELCPVGNANVYQIQNSTPGYYDRPIAVLLGPTCVSMGDLTAQRLRYHPMIRFFGKAPAASLGDNATINNWGIWTLQYSFGDMFHVSTPGSYLNRAEFPIDFPVWHTAYDIANRKDAVVEKAVHWINNTVYGHDILFNSNYCPPGGLLEVEALIENPNLNLISAEAYIENLEGTFLDSLTLLKGRSIASSEVWTGEYQTPSVEDYYKVAICTYDSTENKRFLVPNVNRFSTVGPVELLSYTFTLDNSIISVIPTIINNSISITISNASIKLISTDPWISNIVPSVSSLPELLPGHNVIPDSVFNVSYVDSLCPGYINLTIEIFKDNWLYWVDSMKIIITDVAGNKAKPLAFNLEQNYPNPFNPSTTIKYSIPEVSKVMLTLFNLLGEEVKTLVNEEKVAGNYTVEFNATNLPSGVYFYQLKAAEFVQTRKMILLK